MSDASRKFELLGTPTKLPISVAISVAYRSIRVRLSRSLVTVSSVVLAVTFLLVVLGGEIASNAVFRNWSRDVRPIEDSAQLRTLLLQPRPVLALIGSLRDNYEGTQEWAESLAIALPGEQATATADALSLARWLQSLKPSQRYLLVRNQTIGAWLLAFDAQGQSAEAADTQPAATNATEVEDPLANLAPKVRQLISISADFTGTKLPFSNEQVAHIAEHMPTIRQAVQRLQEAEQKRLQQVADQGGLEAVLDQLRAGADDASLTASGAPLEQLIPGIDDIRRQELMAQLEIEVLRSQAQAVLSKPRIIVDEESGDESLAPLLNLGSLVDGRLNDHPRATELNAELQTAVGSEGLGRLRQDIQRRRTLDDLRSTFSGMNYDPELGKERTLWLVLLSLLVCIVGIVNSMMMAVTERFREIATMKCLGAMDGFILKTFMIESGAVGFVGAILGALIGIILVLVQSSTRYGGSFWSALPTQYLLLAALASLLCGLVLTILGALLPAYKAARMHPIEAMRLEA